MSDTQQEKFTDTNGREWRLSFSLGNARRVKNELGFDIGDLHGGKAFAMLALDPMKLGHLLWVLCESQADAMKVDEESFAEGFGGETLTDALSALEVAVINFSPPYLRETVRKAIAVSIETLEQGAATAVEMVEEHKEQIKGVIEKETRKQMEGITSGNQSQD